MKKIILILNATLILFIACGCSNNLSREKAEKAIREKMKFPRDLISEVQLVSTTTDEFYHGIADQHNTPRKSGVLLKLEQDGFLTYTIQRTQTSTRDNCADGFYSPQSLGNKRYCTTDTYEHRGTLTDKGKQYAANGGFKVATYDLVEITGIVERKELNSADVSYTEIIKDITPFGISLDVHEINLGVKTVTFTKYDDGWRIGK